MQSSPRLRDQIERACADRLAYLGHELRAPLGAIVGMAEVLERVDLSIEHRRCVDTILTSCSALDSVVDSFVDFSRIQAEQITLDQRDFDLHDVIDDILDLFTHAANTKGIDYAALVEPDVPTALRGDPGRLRQVLINLVSNAVKFTAQGEVVVRVKLDREDAREAVLRFVVRDTGVGFTDRAREAIFQPFASFGHCKAESKSGLGLGLYIAKYLSARMGGEIAVENNAPQIGTSCWFTARLDKRPAGAPDVWSPPGALNAAPVLVLHPPSLMRDVLVAQAVACGVRVRAEDDAAKGLKELRAAAYGGVPYEAVLIDARVDRVEIFELVQAIKKDSDLPTPGIVMLAPMVEAPDSIIGTLPEPRTQLLKPIKQSQLADALLRVLRKHESVRPGTPGTVATRVASEGVTPHLRQVENLRRDEPRILLVEDDAASQDAIGQLLRQMGFAVDPAVNGAAAVDAACERRYDAILMDCQMPEMNGARAAAEIRRRQRGARRTPIIGLTASAAESVDRSLVRGEFDDYLRKPARAEEIRAKLDKWCPGGEVPHESGSDLASTLPDPVVVDRLRRTFLDDARARLEVLRRAVDEGDFRTVAQTAHALYGGCLMMGASDLAQACQSLESLARRDKPPPLAETLGTVETEFGLFNDCITNATSAVEGANLAPLTEIKEKPLNSL